jgi:hypothetical protein
MGSLNIRCIYLKLNEKGEVVKDSISAEELFHINPLDDSLFYSFETAYTPYQLTTIGAAPKVDLMLINKSDNKILAGYEVKLTTLPDESTCNLSEDKYGCELVIRMPSIHYLACCLCDMYKTNPSDLKTYFGKNGFGNIASYTEADQVNRAVGDIWNRMNNLMLDNILKQKPAIVQPVWKTIGKSPVLANNCLDVFVWSDLAFTRLFMSESRKTPTDVTKAVDRPTRALVQLFFMLNEFAIKEKFHPKEIFQKLAYTVKNDKAFSVSGRKTYKFMECEELRKPRITKEQIKEIILGGGQNMLSPERRFDAVIVNSPDIFK